MDAKIGSCVFNKRASSFLKDWESVLGITRLSQARNISDGGPLTKSRKIVEFPTGSCYLGSWDNLGMAGVGSYIMPHNVQFEGNLKDGMFHGEGELIYPDGGKLYGEWVNGKAQWLNYEFPDGLRHSKDNWSYCKMPDRRFHASIVKGLQPGFRTLKTNTQPTREIAPNCYDNEEGFYNYKTRCIQDPEDISKILRVPVQAEREWIQKNCRKAWHENAGYRPDLYEEWGSTYNIMKSAEIESSKDSITSFESFQQLDTIRFDGMDDDKIEEAEQEEEIKEETLPICEEEEMNWVKEPILDADLGTITDEDVFYDHEFYVDEREIESYGFEYADKEAKYEMHSDYYESHTTDENTDLYSNLSI